MNQEQLSFANLSPSDIEQINSLEKTLSEQKGEQVILIAYQENGKH